MNFNGQFGSGFTKSNNKGSSYISKLLKQVTGVLVIVLVLILFKYTNNSVGNNLNSTIKNNFYKDYSSSVSYAIKKYSPEVKDAVETFVKNVENQ